MFFVLMQFIFGKVFSLGQVIVFIVFIVLFLIFNFDMLLGVLELITGKLSGFLGAEGVSQSGSFRRELLYRGLELIDNRPFFGEGLASFYNHMNTGFNNFYIQTTQQIGLVGLALFIMIMLAPLIKKADVNYNVYILVIIVLVTLFFSGDIWVPQIFLPYILLGRLNFNEPELNKVESEVFRGICQQPEKSNFHVRHS
jgi:O-antigen ligase